MKGAGSLREARRSKHRREGAKRPSEERSEARDRSDPGAFRALLVAEPSSSERPGGFQAVLAVALWSSERPGGFRGGFTAVVHDYLNTSDTTATATDERVPFQNRHG